MQEEQSKIADRLAEVSDQDEKICALLKRTSSLLIEKFHFIFISYEQIRSHQELLRASYHNTFDVLCHCESHFCSRERMRPFFFREEGTRGFD